MALGIFCKKVWVGSLGLSLVIWACSQRPNPTQFGDHAAELPARVIEVNENVTPSSDPVLSERFLQQNDPPFILKMQRVGSTEQLVMLRAIVTKARHSKVRTETLQLTDWPFEIQGAQVSPDGKWVAFFTNYYPGGQSGLWSLVVFSIDEKFPLRGYDLVKRVVASGVVFDASAQEAQAVFGQHGRLVFYVKEAIERKGAGADAIFATDLMTKKTYLLPTDKNVHRHLTVLASGQITFTAESKNGGERKSYLAQMEVMDFPQTELTQNQHKD